VARWDASVQHLGLSGAPMDRPARLFLCARCRCQVLLCSHCDRGQRYCTPACSRQAREAAQRAHNGPPPSATSTPAVAAWLTRHARDAGAAAVLPTGVAQIV